jgi:hypothetical protein
MKIAFEKSIFTFSLIVLVALAGCKKDDNAKPTEELDEQTSIQVSQTDQVINDALGIVDDGMDGNFDGIGNGRVEACGTISFNLQQGIASIDFGAGCEGTFGRKRAGKITVTFTQTQRTILFQNYITDTYTISGTLTQTNITKSGTVLSYNTTASNLVVSIADKKIVIANMQRKTEINLGTNPRRIADNEVRVTGTVVGINSDGVGFTSEITSPVTIKQACFQSNIFYPVSGTVAVKIDQKSTITINYGNGTCDKAIDVSNGKITKSITLP